MIQMPERYFGYLLVQCADEERSECLNVGVLVFDHEKERVECRITKTLDRVARTLPNVPVSHMRLVLEHARDTASDAYAHLGPDGFATLSAESRGALRYTPVRSILGRHLTSTADELLDRLVEMPYRIGVPPPPSGGVEYWDGAPASIVSSRRVINSVETRLRRFKLVEGKDYRTGVTVNAKTAGRLTIPVWFPLQVRGDLYLDGIEVKSDLNRTLDASRAVAQKVQEAHRAHPSARMNVLIRDPDADKDGELAAAVLTDGAGTAASVLTVSRYSAPADLDNWVHHTLEPELANL